MLMNECRGKPVVHFFRSLQFQQNMKQNLTELRMSQRISDLELQLHLLKANCNNISIELFKLQIKEQRSMLNRLTG